MVERTGGHEGKLNYSFAQLSRMNSVQLGELQSALFHWRRIAFNALGQGEIDSGLQETWAARVLDSVSSSVAIAVVETSQSKESAFTRQRIAEMR